MTCGSWILLSLCCDFFLTGCCTVLLGKPKPVRPPRSPAASKRQNKNADTHSQVLSTEIELSQQVAHNIDNSQPKKLESESTSSVSKVKVAEGKIETPSHKMSNQKSQVSTDKERSTTPPARPRTNAAGGTGFNKH